MPNRVMKGFQAFCLELGIEPLAGGSGRKCRTAGTRYMVWLRIGGVPEHHDRVADKLVDRAAFGEEGFRQHGEVARRLPHQYVGIGRLRDRGKALDIGEDQRDLLFDAAEPGGDGIVKHPADDLLGNEMRERPYRPLREVHGVAQFMNLRDMGRHRHRIGLGEILEFSCLRGNGIQRTRHAAAEHPDHRDEGRADNNREDQSRELELPDVLDKIILGRQQQYAGAVSFAERELRQPEQVTPALVITNDSFVDVDVG